MPCRLAGVCMRGASTARWTKRARQREMPLPLRTDLSGVAGTTATRPAGSADAQKAVSGGLTGDDARRRLVNRPNAMPEHECAPLRIGVGKVLGACSMDARSSHRARVGARQIVEAAIIALSWVQRRARTVSGSRAQATLAALKSRLALTASVKRDGAWRPYPRRSWRGRSG